MNEVLFLENITVDRGPKRRILNLDSFAVRRGELVALVGPNGAGKSTLLQTVNLLQPYQGSLRLFGEEIRDDNQQTLRRRSSMLFQDTLLLSGNVFDNVAWPLRFRGIATDELHERVHKALKDFGCDHLAERPAKQLSGGEAQRVCIARALVSEPELLLLDEPFSSLDVAMRSAMMEEIRTVAETRGITVVLVTHNFADVLCFAERAVALFDGKIVQDDHPEVLLRRPRTEQVARLVGMDNILPCRVEQLGDNRLVTLIDRIRFAYAGPLSGSPAFCCLPGDVLRLYDGDDAVADSDRIVLDGTVERVMPGIGACRIVVRFGGLLLNIRIPREKAAGKFVGGDRIRLLLDPAEAHFV